MVVCSYTRHSSIWLRWTCLIALAVCFGCGKSPAPKPGHAAFVDGCRLWAANDFERAIAAFDKAIKANPEDALALAYRANSYQQLGKSDLALADYNLAIDLDKKVADAAAQPDSTAVPLGRETAQAYFNRATLLANADKPTEAIDDFTESLRLNPRDAKGYCGRGKSFLAKGFVELALDDLTAAITLAPTSYDAYAQRARAWLAAKEYDKAILDSRLSIRFNANSGGAFRTLGLTLLTMPHPQPDKAIECFKEAIHLNHALKKQIDPDLAQAYFDWAINLDRDGKRQEADKAFNEAVRLDTKYAELRKKHNTKIEVVGNDPLRRRTAFKPELADAFVHLDQKHFDQALSGFSDLINKDSAWADPWLGRGSAFLGKGFPDSAVKDFDRAILLAPDLADAYRQRAEAYTKMGDYYRGVQDTTEAIRLKPDFALAYYQRAVAYLGQNSLDSALADLNEAVKLAKEGLNVVPELEAQSRPIYSDIYRGLGVNYISTWHWNEAIDCLEKALAFDRSKAEQIRPQLAKAYRERGLKRAKQGEFDEAMADIKKAFSLDKNNAQNYRVCGLTCYKIAQACRERGSLAEERKQWKAAIDHFNWAMWLDPDLQTQLQRPLADAKRYLDTASQTAVSIQTNDF
jgi:tetratricopeptide (TPR) repeat protein